MTNDQVLILTILVATITMFLWGRWRHDMVAFGALLACVLGGLVDPAHAFAGFGHPAVVTVASVLILSRGLQSSGAVNVLVRVALPAESGPTVSIAALSVLAAILSGFMNNVGALALLMPVAIQLADRLELPPGKVLMPLAFASILGGTVTLIGTPPNLIVSGYRANQEGMQGFAMFDFTAVGLPLTLVGVAFIALVGWRLVPLRKESGPAGFEIDAYITEALVPEKSKAAGQRLSEIEFLLEEADAQVLDLVRNDVRIGGSYCNRIVQAGDILIIEADVDVLSDLLSQLGLQLKEDKQNEDADQAGDHEHGEEAAKGDESQPEPEDFVLMEVVVLPDSIIAGRSASDLLLRTRYSINLLAISRRGHRSIKRLQTLKIRPGDVLLLQGAPEALADFANNSGCVPLAQRELRIPDRRKALVATAIMAAAVAVVAFGLLPPAVAFAAGVLASMVLRTVPPRLAYEAVDWPVVVLLATLLPVAGAMQSSGAADLIARLLLDNLAQGNAVLGLAVILVTTMVLTDLMNNAATAAVMAPIGLGAANQLGVNPDTFLMAVAIGASCAFLTPIGHQNNTLILGPGGFRFGDYWRMGLPVDLLVVAVAMPMLLLVWPL